MIVKAKNGSSSDCGCKNKKVLAKGGCVPKKKKIKKNKNGGYLMVDIPKVQKGKKVFQLDQGELLDPENTVKWYKKTVKDGDTQYPIITETVKFYPQKTNQGVVINTDAIGQIKDNLLGTPDSTLILRPTGSEKFIVPVTKNDPAWKVLWNHINKGKNLNK